MGFKHLIISFFILGLFLPLAVHGKDDLPREFGEIVSVYPGASVAQTRYTRDSVTVIFNSADTYDAVAEYYLQALPEKGWQTLSGTKTPLKASHLQYAKGKILFTLSDHLETNDTQNGFLIELNYPDGRE